MFIPFIMILVLVLVYIVVLRKLNTPSVCVYDGMTTRNIT